MEHQSDQLHRMQCMEVWGGNQAVDTAVVMAGLDAWVYSRPYRGSETGGGDVHYVSSCASGRLTRLLIADVSGHGASASNVAKQLRTLMRRYVNFINPSRFVQEMNASFTADTEVGCFATAVVATYFKMTRSLSLCNAGHPAPLIYHAGTKRWSLLERISRDERPHADLPLGVLKEADHKPFTVKLDRGDCVICYTDSLIEARRADGSELGIQGLLSLAQSLDPSEPGRLIEQFLSVIRQQCEGNLNQDDVTVLLFRPNRQRVSFMNMLMSPVRVLGDLLNRRHRSYGT